MAAAIVPLAVQFLPGIIDLIAGLVHKKAPQVEGALGAGTGPVKFASVFEYVMSALTQAATAGQIPKELPSDDIVKTVIQSVVSSLKLQGLLTQEGIAAVAPVVPQVVAPVATMPRMAGPGVITLASGQSVTIMVK